MEYGAFAMRVLSSKDFWAGLIFGGLGVAVSVFAATNYEVGTSTRMGPGYFPTGIGGIVAVLGLILIVRSFRSRGPRVSRVRLRPLFWVLGGTAAYGYALAPLGFFIATMALVVVAALGSKEFRFMEIASLALALVTISSVVFIYGLGLPFPLWPAIFG